MIYILQSQRVTMGGQSPETKKAYSLDLMFGTFLGAINSHGTNFIWKFVSVLNSPADKQ